MNYLGISWTSLFQNGPSLFKLFQAYYDVTTGHMTLRFEIFWRETANWQRKNSKFGQGKYTIVQNLVALQHVCGYKYAEGIQEYTENTMGMPKVGYLLVISHI